MDSKFLFCTSLTKLMDRPVRGMTLQLERAARSSTTNSLLCFCCLPLPYLCMHRFFLTHQDHHKLLPIEFVAEVNVRSRGHCEVDAAACVTRVVAYVMRAGAYARWRSFVLIPPHRPYHCLVHTSWQISWPG